MNESPSTWRDEEDAKKRVYDNMLPTYCRALVNVFDNVILCFHATKKDRINLFVKITFSDMKVLDDYDNEEAWKSFATKRKFLFDKILKENDTPELYGPEDDDDSQTEVQQ